jgi:hypothetical protein
MEQAALRREAACSLRVFGDLPLPSTNRSFGSTFFLPRLQAALFKLAQTEGVTSGT